MYGCISIEVMERDITQLTVYSAVHTHGRKRNEEGGKERRKRNEVEEEERGGKKGREGGYDSRQCHFPCREVHIVACV